MPEGMTKPQESTALVVIPAGELPILLSNDKTDILGRLLADLAGYEPDASTEKGRREINAKKKRVGSAKMDFVRLAKTVTADAKKIMDGTRAEVQTMERLLDGLRDRIGAPLAEYEEREHLRVAAHEEAIALIESWADVPPEWTSEQIAARIGELGNDPVLARDFQEFKQRAERASKAAYNALVAAKVAAVAREGLAAEKAKRERTAELEQALAVIEAIGAVAEDTPVRELHMRRAKVTEAYTGRDWQELADDAQTAFNRVSASLDGLIAAAEAREAEAQRQREADAAERARKEAEAKAEQDRIHAEKRAAEEKRQLEEKIAADQRRAEQAEAARIERHRSTIESLDTADRFQSGNPSSAAIQARIDQLAAFVLTDLEEFADEAERTCNATLTRLDAMLTEATEREERQAAALEEARRKQAEADAAAKLKAQQEAERAEQEKRARNKAHLAAVNRDAAAAIMKAISEVHTGNQAEALAIAKAVVTALAKGEVPNCRIEY